MHLRIMLTLLTCLIAFTLSAQDSRTDTIFLKKDSLYGAAQSIYIETRAGTKFHDRINNWTLDEYQDGSYQYSINYLKEQKQRLTKKTSVVPFTKWLPLVQHKGKLYAYHPCDFYHYYKLSVNDTTFIDWTEEGPVANKILKQKKIARNTFELSLTGVYEKDRTLIIHIIDNKKGIAVFEETINGTDKSYYLMVAAESLNAVPMIVNNCEHNKQLEWQFDEEPNYAELLRKKH